jgi:predicted PurR-regulated permease PerM
VTSPTWRHRADAWFKFLGAIVLAYVIVAWFVGLLVQFLDVTMIGVGAILLAYFFVPLVHWLNRRLPLWAALTVVYGAATLLVMLAAYFVAAPLISQAQTLTSELPALQGMLTQRLSDPDNAFFAHLPAQLRSYLSGLPETIGAALRNDIGALTNSIARVLFSVASFGAIVIAIPIVSVYMLAESPAIKRYVLERVPDRFRDETRNILADVNAVIGGFIRGQLVVAACVAVLAAIAFVALGLPYGLVIAAWVGLADIIPYVGPFAGAIPAVLLAAISGGWFKVLLVVVALVLINQVEAHLLAPRVVGRTVRLSPLVVIFALLIGGQAFGLAGLLLAVPVAGIIRVLVDRLIPAKPLRTIDVRPGLTQQPQAVIDPLDPADRAG